MRKLIKAAVAVLAIGLWLIPIRAAAQGRGVCRPDGAPAVSGGHAPLDASGADVDNRHGSVHETTTSGSKDAEKKAPDQLLAQNTKLSDHLSSLLTKMGVNATPQQACATFKNLGQCVAAVHVADNLGIDFNKLACDMTLKPVTTSACPAGTGTGLKGMSLGASIDALKPGTDGKTETKKAVT